MRIAIIGGGAAGLMAAATIHELHSETELFLIEKNDGLGKKVIISGGGRCNVTTGIPDVRSVLTRYPRGNKFLSSAIYSFPPAAVYDWFESHGVPLKIEDDLRVFPQSNNGKDIVGVFEQMFRHSSVRTYLKASATRVLKQGDKFHVFLKDKDEPLIVDKLILTTGGQAYRHTGSTGDGYAFAMSLGHTLTPLAPSLNSFTTQEKWTADVSGLSFEKAKLSSSRDRKFHFTGPFLFTHKGVSGPAVFALSSLVAFEVYDANKPLDIVIDIFPDQSPDDVRAEIERVTTENPKKNIVNVLGFVIPKSLAEVMCRELELPDKRANELSKTEMRSIVAWLKGIPLQAIGRGAGDEFVTAGGIPLTEVDPSTMESKLCPDLYFAGEILDVDGYTGGFNLQASWATGRLAGQSASE